MLPKAHLTLYSLPCVTLQITSCKQSPPRTLRPVLTTAHQLAEITWKPAVGCDLPSPSSLGALPFLLSPKSSSLSIWNQKLFISLQLFFHSLPCHSSWPFFFNLEKHQHIKMQNQNSPSIRIKLFSSRWSFMLYSLPQNLSNNPFFINSHVFFFCLLVSYYQSTCYL